MDEQELKIQLQEALSALADKERDLIMAAEFGQQLIAQNNKMQAQLDEALAQSAAANNDDQHVQVALRLRQTLRETEKTAERSIQALTRQNQTLTQDLRQALQDHKRSEHEHSRLVRSLEADLDALRSQLDLTVKRANLLETEVIKAQSLAAANADGDALEENIFLREKLEKELAECEDKKNLAENALKQTTTALQEALTRLHDQEDRLQAASAMRHEFEIRGTLIIQLKDQIEDLRHSLEMYQQDSAGHNHHQDKKDDEEGERMNVNWEWTPWLENVKAKAWDRDIKGLTKEVADLRKHRQEAYNKLKIEMDNMLSGFVNSLPDSVKVGVERVAAGVVGIIPIATTSSVPSKLSASDDDGVENIGKITAMFPNIPRDSIEKDLAVTKSVRLTIENILNGFVRSTPESDQQHEAKDKLTWSVANADEE